MGRPKGSVNKSKETVVQEVEALETTPSKSTAVAKVDNHALTPMAMFERAIANGATAEMFHELMDVQERWEGRQARKAFDVAISEAKAEIPVLLKNRTVDFANQKGGRTNYRYEDLGGIAEVVNPILSKHGLSYRYKATSNVNEPVMVTCIVSHRDGHFEEITLAAGRDDSGNKNSIQAISSTMTYLQRITLKAALGLAVSNDDDGQASEPKGHVATPVRDGAPPRPAKPDPITSGPIRDEGPSDDSNEPRFISGNGESYDSWAKKFIELIQTSPDRATLLAWTDKNNVPLSKLKAGKPSVSAQVDVAIRKVHEALEPKKKAEKPEAKPEVKAEPPVENPEDILNAIEAELAAVENPDDLQGVWETACAPLMAKLSFPSDIDAAQAIMQRTEQRLGAD